MLIDILTLNWRKRAVVKVALFIEYHYNINYVNCSGNCSGNKAITRYTTALGGISTVILLAQRSCDYCNEFMRLAQHEL